MDNLTHTLAGAALAEVALRDHAPLPRRRLFLAAGILGSNLPDLDVLYAGITPAPLGYLLHHRGHTHTLLGGALQAALLAAVFLGVPAVRRLVAAEPGRFGALVAVSLFGHLAMDAWNSYGVHPFHPADRRWYYGDAVFILEPWLWVLLGVAGAFNATTRPARVALVALVTLLPGGLALVGLVPGRGLAILAAGGLAFAWVMRRASPRTRAGAALAGSVLLATALFALSRRAHAEVTARLEPERRGEIVDLVLSPNPGSFSCWAVIAVEKHDSAGEYVLHRGTLSLLPDWQPPTECASYRFARGRERGTAGPSLAWNERIRAPLASLRDLSGRDCWVRAWLQFGRAPYVREGVIRDLRFDNGAGNFTAMEVAPEGAARGCPPHMTSWAMPRLDLLRP